MATKDWNGFKKNGDTYIPNDATARTGLQNKVDKVTGKGLSTNDYDNTAKAVVSTAQDNIKANTKLIKDTVGWSGKNKCPRFSNYSKANVIFTVDSDGAVDITTSAAASANVWNIIDSGLPVLENGKKYKVSGLGTSTNQDGYVAGDNNGADYVYVHDEGNGGEFTYDSSKPLKKIQIGLKSGQTASHIKLSPMIYDADILDDTYEPYFGSTAFPRSEQAVLGARQWLDKSKAVADSGVLFEQVATGIRVYNTTAKSYAVVRIPCTLKIDTNYRFKTDIDYTSGVGYVSIQYSDNGSNWEVLKDILTDYTSDGSVNDIFNSGNHAYYRIALCSTRETSETGDVTYNNLIITLASDDTMAYSDYAMTNKELTEKVQGIINAAVNAADFAEFKTAIGNL